MYSYDPNPPAAKSRAYLYEIRGNFGQEDFDDKTTFKIEMTFISGET